MHANSTVFDVPSKSGKFSGQGSEKSHCDSFKGTFSILDYLDRLIPTGETGKYNCPGCGGHNLSINTNSGAYTCFNGCEPNEIRRIIAPRRYEPAPQDKHTKRIERQLDRLEKKVRISKATRTGRELPYMFEKDEFNIQQHLDKLEPSPVRGHYICPGCGGEHLFIYEDMFDCPEFQTGNCDEGMVRREIGFSYSRADLVKLELKIFLGKPLADRIIGLAEVSIRYGISTSNLERILRDLEGQTRIAEPACFSLKDFLLQSEPAIQYIVPGIVPKAETVLLAGASGAGKTQLAVDLAYAVATGTEFLGETVPKGKVLFISIDESPRSTRFKLDKRGFDPEIDGDQLQILTRWDISQLPALEKILEDFRPDLVIIDSLKRISLGSTISENSAEFADNLYRIKELLTRYNAAGLLLHHVAKNPEATGKHQARGSTAIAAALWGTCIIWQRPKPDPGNKKKLILDPTESKRVLDVFPKDAEGQSINIDRNPEDHHFFRTSTVGESDDVQTMRQRILKAFEINPHRVRLTAADLIELLELEPENRYIYKALDLMVERRQLLKEVMPTDRRVRFYSLPTEVTQETKCKNTETEKNYSPPPSPPSVPGGEYNSTDHTRQDFQDIHHLFTPPENYSPPNDGEHQGENNQNLESDDISGVIHPLPQKEGGGETMHLDAEVPQATDDSPSNAGIAAPAPSSTGCSEEQPELPPDLEPLTDKQKAELLGKRGKAPVHLWYVGSDNRYPKLLTFRRLDLVFGQYRAVVQPQGWIGLLSLYLNEVAVVKC